MCNVFIGSSVKYVDMQALQIVEVPFKILDELLLILLLNKLRHSLFSESLPWTLFSLNISNEKQQNNNVYHDLPFKFYCVCVILFYYTVLLFVLYSQFVNETIYCWF